MTEGNLPLSFQRCNVSNPVPKLAIRGSSRFLSAAQDLRVGELDPIFSGLLPWHVSSDLITNYRLEYCLARATGNQMNDKEANMALPIDDRVHIPLLYLLVGLDALTQRLLFFILLDELFYPLL